MATTPPLSPPLEGNGTPECGSIQAILGPMFSGKSTELLRRMKRYSIAKNCCVLIKYNKDTRYSVECVSTHDRQQMRAVSAEKLEPLAAEMGPASVIGIDEGQFFPDLISFCENMANAGKTVIVAALDGTFQRKPFGSILELVPLAEHVVKLSAVCFNCSRDAPFSKRIVEGDEVEVIGGADKYVAACRACFMLPNHKIKVTPETPPPTLLLGGPAHLLGRNVKPSIDNTTSTKSTTELEPNRQLFPSD